MIYHNFNNVNIFLRWNKPLSFCQNQLFFFCLFLATRWRISEPRFDTRRSSSPPCHPSTSRSSCRSVPSWLSKVGLSSSTLKSNGKSSAWDVEDMRQKYKLYRQRNDSQWLSRNWSPKYNSSLQRIFCSTWGCIFSSWKADTFADGIETNCQFGELTFLLNTQIMSKFKISVLENTKQY